MTNPNRFKATYQHDEVWFITDESHRDGIPADAIVYTLAEAEVLANRSEWTRQIAHEVKRLTRPQVGKQPDLFPQPG